MGHIGRVRIFCSIIIDVHLIFVFFDLHFSINLGKIHYPLRMNA